MRFAEKALLLVLAEFAVGLAVLNVLVWNGFLVDDGVDPAVPARVPRPQPVVPPTDPGTAVANRSRPASAAKRRPSADRLRFELAAVDGDSWTSVRRGSADGEVLYEGVLTSGDSVRFTGRRLWLRLGAASNVEILVNGEEVEDVPPGTVDLVLPERTA
jgi:uncharacterized protein DUF4115